MTTQTFTVTAANTAPVANAQSVSTNEDTAKTITLTGTDADGNSLTFAIGTGPSHGSLGSIGAVTCTGTAPKSCSADVTYTPALNYNGSDSFTFKVNDGTVDSAAATVSITVTAVNDAPSCSAVLADRPTRTLPGDADPSCTDIDSASLTYVDRRRRLARHGLDRGRQAALLRPTPTTTAADSFTYKANDGALDSNTATVSVTVTAVNDAPSCSAVSLTTDEDTPGDANPSCTDIDSASLTYAIVGAASHGTASIVAGKLHYVPNANYNGSDSFTYKANDGALDSNTATVSVTVNAVNDAPPSRSRSTDTRRRRRHADGDTPPVPTSIGDAVQYSTTSRKAPRT